MTLRFPPPPGSHVWAGTPCSLSVDEIILYLCYVASLEGFHFFDFYFLVICYAGEKCVPFLLASRGIPMVLIFPLLSTVLTTGWFPGFLHDD